MPSWKPPRRPGNGEMIMPLSKRERILELLKIQTEVFPKELSREEIDLWAKDLDCFPIAAIEWAFENWRKSGRFFPVPADILDQCKTWQSSEVGGWKCSNECQDRHGKGYHWNDMLWLFKRMQKEISANRPVDHDALLKELDDNRAGGAPAWRR